MDQAVCINHRLDEGTTQPILVGAHVDHVVGLLRDQQVIVDLGEEVTLHVDPAPCSKADRSKIPDAAA